MANKSNTVSVDVELTKEHLEHAANSMGFKLIPVGQTVLSARRQISRTYGIPFDGIKIKYADGRIAPDTETMAQVKASFVSTPK